MSIYCKLNFKVDLCFVNLIYNLFQVFNFNFQDQYDMSCNDKLKYIKIVNYINIVPFFRLKLNLSDLSDYNRNCT